MRIEHNHVALTGLLTGILGLAAPTAQAQDHYTPVAWDDRGVPHVVAPTDEQVFFGQGYATAVDRLGQLHRIREATHGRLADLIGPYAPIFLPCSQNPAGKLAIDQDDEVVTLGFRASAQQRLDSLDGATRSALESYAAGINYYLHELDRRADDTPPVGTPLGAEIDPLVSEILAGELEDLATGDYAEWTPQDSIAVWIWWIYMFEKGSENFANELPADSTNNFIPPANPGFEVLQSTDMTGVIDEITRYANFFDSMHKRDCDNPNSSVNPFSAGVNAPEGAEAPRSPRESRPYYHFSETWALSGDANAGGSGAAVQASPKTPMLSPSMFHEVHLVQTDSTAGFDARGAQIVGCPGLFVGFTEDVAWGVASLDADTDDLIKLNTVEGQNEHLYLDENGVTVLDAFDPVPLPSGGTAYSTDLGPVVNALINPNLVDDADDHYVLRSADIWHKEERHTIQSAIRMLKARDVESFRELAKFWVTPSLHCVVGDSSGTIGYQSLLSAPTRGEQALNAGLKAVSPTGDPGDDWLRTVPMDYLPWTIKENGTLDASNNRPAGCWYPVPLHLSVARGPSTRTLRLFEIFNGYDPDYPSVTDFEDLARMAFDGGMPHGRLLVELGVLFRDQPTDKFVNWNLSLPTEVENFLTLELEPWLNAGGQSEVTGTPPCSNIYTYLDELPWRVSVNEPVLFTTYGNTANGWIALLCDLRTRDLVAEPFGTYIADTEVFTYIDRLLQQSLARWEGTIPRKCCNQAFAGDFGYYDFTSFLGGATPSVEPTKDINGLFLKVQDQNTLWSANSRAYAHTVDLSDPTTARGINPLGNHEDPDHPELGDFFGTLAGYMGTPVNDLWVNGIVGSGPTPYLDGQESMSLTAPSSVSKVTRIPAYPEQRTHTYFGVDYSGWDPRRALSIEPVGAPPVMEAGTSVQLRISGLPENSDFEITGSSELRYTVEVRASFTKTWTPDGSLPIVHHVDETVTPFATVNGVIGETVVSYCIPATAGVSDRIAIQAILTLENMPTLPGDHPLRAPDLKISTMGLQLHPVNEVTELDPCN